MLCVLLPELDGSADETALCFHNRGSNAAEKFAKLTSVGLLAIK